MIKTNRDRLVMQSLQGEISHPRAGTPYRIKHDGTPHVLPATGGITYNIEVGDPAIGWAGDHVEPGVSMKIGTEGENAGLMLLSCIGNEAKVVSGDAKGAKGFVTGAHGGIDHVIVYFPQEDLDNMAIGDKILIRSQGQGMELSDHPETRVMNVDPELFQKLNITESQDGVLEVPVVTEIPAYLM
ncbi:MAG: DUF4438 domain-containing protein, partial [Sphaerochaetaceae bacterium]